MNEGDKLKEAGIKRVSGRAFEWLSLALPVLKRFCEQADGQFTSDDFRVWAWEQGFHEEPHHPNAWGALFNIAAHSGVLAKTDRVRKSLRAKAHGRKLTLCYSLSGPNWRSRFKEVSDKVLSGMDDPATALAKIHIHRGNTDPATALPGAVPLDLSGGES